jgi:glycerophosphoryl diester phosphodiesterase
LAPENTLAAFGLAADLGAQAIETDLQLTRDGRIVLVHDEKLRRTTNGRGLVTHKTMDELRRLDAGSWFRKRGLRNRRAPSFFAGERIPTLEELLDLARQRQLDLYLEIKAPCARGTEHATVSALHDSGSFSRCHVICFDPEVLGRVRQIDPTVPLGYLFNRRHRGALTKAVATDVKTILPHATRVTPKLIAEARNYGLRVVTWTVNDPKQMKELIALGVDGIMSDFPDRLAAVVAGT